MIMVIARIVTFDLCEFCWWRTS